MSTEKESKKDEPDPDVLYNLLDLLKNPDKRRTEAEREALAEVTEEAINRRYPEMSLREGLKRVLSGEPDEEDVQMIAEPSLREENPHLTVGEVLGTIRDWGLNEFQREIRADGVYSDQYEGEVGLWASEDEEDEENDGPRQPDFSSGVSASFTYTTSSFGSIIPDWYDSEESDSEEDTDE